MEGDTMQHGQKMIIRVTIHDLPTRRRLRGAGG